MALQHFSRCIEVSPIAETLGTQRGGEFLLDNSRLGGEGD